MSEKDLYPIISDDEFRGEGFFLGGVKHEEIHVYTEVPDTYGATMWGGERLILERRDDTSYWICAVERDLEWRSPRPTYEKTYLRYIINASDLVAIKPR